MDVRHARARLIVEALPGPGETVRLPPDEAAHARARRLAPGDPVIVLDGSGRSAAGEVVRVTGRETIVRVGEVVAARDPEHPVTLLVAGLRSERLAWVVEKATELGAARVTIVESDRTQPFRASARLLPRLERIAREAAKQCERVDWPALEGPVAFARALEAEPSGQRFLLDAEGEQFPDRLALSRTALLVGPEGGWTDAERSAASSCGWRIVRLPAGKLRAETAAVGALLFLRRAIESDR